MGVKKKGSLANRLARMSDDERAKYLQRKADIEEEARRRKEQLVVTFMKNKLKREDAFARLNIAKINQQWHQIMRSDKCKDMKEEAEYLRKRIDKIISFKNKTIIKSLEELDWQEELYGKNFGAHSDHIDKIIEAHESNLKQLRKQYKGDQSLLLDTGATERQAYENQISEDIEFINSVIYGQEVEAKRDQNKKHEAYVKRKQEILNSYKLELNHMKKERERICSVLWMQISKVLQAYVNQTDVRRSHMAELQKLDAEGSAFVSANQKLIDAEEVQLISLLELKGEYTNLLENHNNHAKSLKRTELEAAQKFLEVKKDLMIEIKNDEKRLVYLSNVSNEVIHHLETIALKGEKIIQLWRICKKLEYEANRVSKRFSAIDEIPVKALIRDESASMTNEDSPVGLDDVKYQRKFSAENFGKLLEGDGVSSSDGSSNGINVSYKAQDVSDGRKDNPIGSNLNKTLRPKTGALQSKKYSKPIKSNKSIKPPTTKQNQVFKISTKVTKNITNPENLDNTLEKPTLPLKELESSLKKNQKSLSFEKSLLLPAIKSRTVSAPHLFSHSSTPKPSTTRSKTASSSSENKFKTLNKLQNFWSMYNKVVIEYKNLRSEKTVLIRENDRLKDEIKDILEAAALRQSVPDVKSTSVASSRKRLFVSSPISSYNLL